MGFFCFFHYILVWLRLFDAKAGTTSLCVVWLYNILKWVEDEKSFNIGIVIEFHLDHINQLD